MAPLQPWIAEVERLVGSVVRAARPLHGGCVSEVFVCECEDGRSFAVKIDRAGSRCLSDEATMLRFLAERSRLPVPRVCALSAGEGSGPAVLVCEFVANGGSLGEAGERHAAELLAELHAVRPEGEHANDFGFATATRIGGLVQTNRWTASWTAFFAEHRLLEMARQARDAGRLPPELARRVGRLGERLDRWLREPAAPSLVHGDVWSGNVLVAPGGGAVAAFVDPAIYFGHAEIELAFITLFGTFGGAFFDRYAPLRPIEPGFFEERRDLYNLYPLLVHARLFGGAYIDSVDRTLRRYGA